MSLPPNLTELFYLLGIPYKEMNTDEELKSYLRQLSDCGPEVVIITSVPVRDDKHKTSVYAYNRNGNRYWKVTCPYLPAHYPGTGIRLPVSSPEHCCKATVCPLPWTVPRSSFCKVSVLLSDTSTTTVKVYSLKRYCIISTCRFKSAAMN